MQLKYIPYVLPPIYIHIRPVLYVSSAFTLIFIKRLFHSSVVFRFNFSPFWRQSPRRCTPTLFLSYSIHQLCRINLLCQFLFCGRRCKMCLRSWQVTEIRFMPMRSGQRLSSSGDCHFLVTIAHLLLQLFRSGRSPCLTKVSAGSCLLSVDCFRRIASNN